MESETHGRGGCLRDFFFGFECFFYIIYFFFFSMYFVLFSPPKATRRDTTKFCFLYVVAALKSVIYIGAQQKGRVIA